ncbi:hypothetical protein Bcav_0679 [Beutenbergia cavernae DSM 12333]|uniref:Integral membrane protein n=1 Tax=Beutenbergia cavernae (strain ATCC BAA-8 / DSM 12333 / CCUG 43141 / JCM 11478 / NBRC 16432 / NCIMB 13614 / HKI 0122) TaxID=471853 RepID=C5BYI2_BEUC1|nr:hypothetical protein [Beutenbergia cavernae]ACQ78940.1 hypothetical protein Bcav_0679 [Beutenbergia cavernae DSM 12333]
MDEQDDAQLRARLAQLEQENASLRARLEGPADAVAPVAAPAPPSRGRGRAALATVLIVLGCLLAPLAVVTGWAKATLTDTDAFVATYAPLAEDPEVQAFVTDQVMDAITSQVDVEQITSDAIDAVIDLGTGPRATTALEALKGPAASGLTGLIENGVSRFVTSDAFATAWTEALRISHTQATGTLQNDPDAALVITDEGTLGIQLGPIVERVKTALVDRGITFAANIPEVNRTIVVAESDALPTAQLAYSTVVTVGTWLPWVALALLAGGVLVARRKSTALVRAAIGLALAAGVLALAFAVGRTAVVAALPASTVPGDVARLLYDTAVDRMRATTTALLVLAVVVAVVAWLAGPFGVPTRLRDAYSGAVAGLRSSAEERGVTTGSVGEWVFRHRTLLFAAIAVIPAAVLLLSRPLTSGTILGWLVAAVVAVIVVTFVERPPGTAAGAGPADRADGVVLTGPGSG